MISLGKRDADESPSFDAAHPTCFAQKVGELLGVPVVAVRLSSTAEFAYPSGDRDSLTVEDNHNQLSRWQPGWAIMARTGGAVVVVDVDPRNGGDIVKTRQLLDGLRVQIFAELATPSGGRHFYIAGHPELPSCKNLTGWPGIDVLSFGSLVFLPGTQRPKYAGAGYQIVFDNVEALADGGDPDGAEAFAGWVAERRANPEQFGTAPPWTGVEAGAREAQYLAAMLAGIHRELSSMGKDSGRNTAVYNAGLKCGNFIAGAGLSEEVATEWLLDASNHNGLIAEDGQRSVLASIRSGISNGKNQPRAVPRPNIPPVTVLENPPEPAEPVELDAFWDARPVLAHIRDFARARRVGPWALLGCVLVRVVAATSNKIVLPALTGGEVPLNLYAGIVAFTGAGKGTAEKAARAAIDLPHVDVVGPGSGEGIGHLFKFWDNKDKTYVQYRDAVILSAAEVSTLNALRTRPASTLFPELNKAWMGEPLGFSYVAREKSIALQPHEYRLCLVTGIQPANAYVILDDVDSGSPARYLWLPTSDPGAPAVTPNQPPMWRGWSLARSVGNLDSVDPTQLRPMEVCQTARDAVDKAALDRLHEKLTDFYNSHALLSRLKTAGALALLNNRPAVITEEDWQLAGIVHEVSDRTRQRVIDMLTATKAESNRVRAEAEAHRAIVIDNRMAEHSTRRVGRTIMRKLDKANDWMPRSELRRTALESKDRGYFEDAIEALKISGQVEERELEADHRGHVGTEYRRAR
jgi:hypothetical protein